MEKKATILCVDDEAGILSSLERCLHLAGYHVLTAQGGAEGITVLQKERVDLVIADQRMPQMSGSEFLKIVKERYPDIVSIMLSGHSDFNGLLSAVNEGEIFRFISKPWDKDNLLSVISSALETRSAKWLTELLLKSVHSLAVNTPNIHIDAFETAQGVSVRIMDGGKVFSEETIYSFLNDIFNRLGVSQDERIKMVSGAVVRQKGKVVLFINVGQGVMLNIEIPKTCGGSSEQGAV